MQNIRVVTSAAIAGAGGTESIAHGLDAAPDILHAHVTAVGGAAVAPGTFTVAVDPANPLTHILVTNNEALAADTLVVEVLCAVSGDLAKDFGADAVGEPLWQAPVGFAGSSYHQNVVPMVPAGATVNVNVAAALAAFEFDILKTIVKFSCEDLYCLINSYNHATGMLSVTNLDTFNNRNFNITILKVHSVGR